MLPDVTGGRKTQQDLILPTFRGERHLKVTREKSGGDPASAATPTPGHVKRCQAPGDAWASPQSVRSWFQRLREVAET
jgi:hypothetical protein